MVARSSGYEVCPHNPEQCDTKTLELNNNTWGEQATDEQAEATKESTKELEQMEENPPLISSTFFDGWTTQKSTRTKDVETNISASSPTMYKVDNTVAKAGIIDDSYWRTLHINSQNGNVCSYRLLN